MTQPAFPGFPEFAKELFGAEPRLPFFSAVQGLGGRKTPQGRFFGNQFENIQNEFFGLLGSQIQDSLGSGSGQIPSLTFEDFLGDIDFNKRFRSTAPSLRGQGGQARFRPPTRFLF